MTPRGDIGGGSHQSRGSDDGFPGGRTRLPRINRPRSRSAISDPEPVSDPELLVGASAFRSPAFAHHAGENTQRISSAGDDTEFGQYYSSESLFESSREQEVNPKTSDGPYGVLGLTRQASWEQIRSAHRTLVSSLHPDRFVGEAPEIIEDAERRVRDVNEAFAEIRRQRSVGSR